MKQHLSNTDHTEGMRPKAGHGMTYQSKTTALLLSALLAALTAVFSVVSLPLPFTPVPVNLATLSVMLAGGLLGHKYGTLSQTVYVLLGAVGVPVFHSFSGGLGILVGPTGGYLMGYVAAAFAIGLLLHLIDGSPPFLLLICTLVVGALVYLSLGTAWFMLSTGVGLLPALTACVFPFLPGEALKITAAAILLPRLSPFIRLPR